MKFLKTSAICVLLTVCFLQSSAQKTGVPLNEPDYNKPKLFADLPEKIDINVSSLDLLFNEQNGKSVSVNFTPNISLHGVVVSRAKDDLAKSNSIVIKLTGRIGAIFSFTKIENGDGTFNYVGRIISRQHIDAYEIAKDKGQFVLQKKSLYDLYSE